MASERFLNALPLSHRNIREGFPPPAARSLIFMQGDGLIHKLRVTSRPPHFLRGIKFLAGLHWSCLYQRPHLPMLVLTKSLDEKETASKLPRCLSRKHLS